jgi:hypothetical protein
VAVNNSFCTAVDQQTAKKCLDLNRFSRSIFLLFKEEKRKTFLRSRNTKLNSKILTLKRNTFIMLDYELKTILVNENQYLSK